jgi:hypothetical protein
MPGKLGLPAGTGFAHEGRNREPPVRNILFASILITAIPASASDDTGFYVQGSVQAALWNHVVSEYCHGYDDDSDLMNSEYSGGLTLNLAYRFSNYFELGLANHFMFSSRNTPEFGGWSAFHYKATPRARLLWPLSQNFNLYLFAEAGFVLFKNYWIPPDERSTAPSSACPTTSPSCWKPATPRTWPPTHSPTAAASTATKSCSTPEFHTDSSGK